MSERQSTNYPNCEETTHRSTPSIPPVFLPLFTQPAVHIRSGKRIATCGIWQRSSFFSSLSRRKFIMLSKQIQLQADFAATTFS
ncbi:unnamed protein product [Coffea canephora]|uniref:Uncharacterized protein n=1 Tax=Coffea canephora TaxID=49390 RepID=A0A068TN27_COFCA|nr:unnamed protein product [Coffea canephora]